MSFLEEVHAKHKKLTDVLADDHFSGIRETVEKLYPDKAHFIYELLQNAEDAGATEASFTLDKKSLKFEHNGRPFDKDDVWGITNIGKSTKKDQDDKIGRFGIGFKAVFAYSETPHIWSPTFSFKISDLMLPSAIPEKSGVGQSTYFEFPFDSPKMSATDAYQEIASGFDELAETTMLFLSNLESIRWQIGQQVVGEVLRIHHSEHHVEVLKQSSGMTAVSSHFLRFSSPVKGLEKQNVTLAFNLDCLPTIKGFDHKKPLATQLKIVPAKPGRVAVFFPADKETSGLRFHLHAPFVSELSRASIKETATNQPLFRQLAELAAASLHIVRDLNLLTGDFLGVLPNPQDTIPIRYQHIREAIIEEMNNEQLTPTHDKSHAPAKYLLQAKASLKDLLSEEDLRFLVEYTVNPSRWAIGASQKNSNQDRFLTCLEIRTWDLDKFIHKFKKSYHQQADGRFAYETERRVLEWFGSKTEEWHQKLYALLYKELGSENTLSQLDDCPIVRLSDGTYAEADKCYFPSNGVEHDEILPRVARGVYSSGKNKTQQADARKLLEEVGVREVGEVEQIEVILKARYTRDAIETGDQDQKTHWKDIRRFMLLLEKEPDQAEIFAKYLIFSCDDDYWRIPSAVYLDSPYGETGLHAFYEALGEKAEYAALSSIYQDSGISSKKLAKFAEAVGAQSRLQIQTTNCCDNPQWSYLFNVSGQKNTSPINRDYTIKGLADVLSKPTIELSRLVWMSMCCHEQCGSSTGMPFSFYKNLNTLHYNGDAANLRRLTSNLQPYFRACYQRNQTNGARYADSQLVHQLKSAAWIPQGDSRFVRPAEALRELLPAGFTFDEDYAWLTMIGFGESVGQEAEDISEPQEQQQERQEIVKSLGFADEEALADAQWFAGLKSEDRQQLKEEIERRTRPCKLPDNEPRNPQRRSDRVGQQAANAPGRKTEKRERSVSVGMDEVKQEAAEYLRQQYTNVDDEMICQVCKAPLPFKLDNGSYFFEKVEFLGVLNKRHHQNYLALCPNHSAMFQHANGSRDLLAEMFSDIAGNELEIILAQANATVYFTKTHIADLKAVIAMDGTAEDC